MVCYSNELKTAWAGVPAELIQAKGAVSAEVAIALAEGIRRRVGSTFGVGITGIAGPGGGTEEKPVGTVHIALAHPGGVKERGVRFPGDRESIRFQASQVALDMVRIHFLYNGKQPPNSSLNMRLFVALEIPAAVRDNLAAQIKMLRDFSVQVADKRPRWVRPENLHVTLKFIGELSPAKFEGIRSALAAMHSDAPVHLHFRGLGFFPNEQYPRVLWAGVNASANLPSLAADIDSALGTHGVARETRAFSPHLTLARFEPPGLHEKLRAMIEQNSQHANSVRSRRANFI